MDFNLGTHLVQTQDWGNFKTLMGTKSIRVGDIQFTKHKIPLLNYYIAYAPRVNFFKQNFKWEELIKVAKDEKCAFIRFDVPNILMWDKRTDNETKILSTVKRFCKKSSQSTFAKYNVLLDLSPPEKVLLANLKPKTRYNVKLSTRKGVSVRFENSQKGVAIFNKLHRETANRDRFLRHSDDYYQKVYEVFSKKKKTYILVASFNNEPLVAWMLFIHNKTLYYPFGASSSKHRNLMASSLVAWESIRLGKNSGCKVFDMWGATNDEKDNWWGFTRFKLGYGGQLVKYIDSYDFIINPTIANSFNALYALFWKLRNVTKHLYR